MSTTFVFTLLSYQIEAVIHCFSYHPDRLFEYEIQLPVYPSEYTRWSVSRKASFTAGRMALKLAQQNMNAPSFDLPRLPDGSPNWPDGWLGSLSHTDQEAIAVVLPRIKGRLKGIGIDIESRKHALGLHNSANLIGTMLEQQRLYDRGMNVDEALLCLFSIKESLYKAVYPTLRQYFDFLDAELVDIDMNGEWCLQLTRDLSPLFHKGFECRGGMHYWENKLVTYVYW